MHEYGARSESRNRNRTRTGQREVVLLLGRCGALRERRLHPALERLGEVANALREATCAAYESESEYNTSIWNKRVV